MSSDENLMKSCRYFSDQAVLNISRFLDQELQAVDNCIHTDKLDESQSVYFSMPFQGEVFGEFIFGMSKNTALYLINEGDVTSSCFEELKEDIFDAFKEILNWSVGQTMEKLTEDYDKITITAPKVTLGQLHFPPATMYRSDLQCGDETISCYLYVDSMVTDLVECLQTNKKEIEDLKKEKENLQRINQAKTDFLANMSHELRTPLNGVIGIIDLLKKTSLSDHQRKQLETVSKSGDLLLGIINDILEFSKIERGKIEVEEKSFNLRESLEGFLEAMAHQVYTKGLDFYVNMPTVMPLSISADEVKIKQVLINLVGNAVKFTPKGSIDFRLSHHNVDGQDRLKFEVHDTGVGIPEEKISSIFYSFSQADISDTRKYGGSGLGLTISKSIVEAMGGTLSVESKEAEGSIFSFEIPVKVDEMEESKKMEVSQPILLCLHDKKEEKALSEEIHHLIQEPVICTTSENLEDELKKNPGATLVFDWLLWNRLSKDKKEVLKKAEYIAFHIAPNCLGDVEWHKKSLEGVAGGLLCKPFLRPNLVEMLERKDLLFSQSYEEDEIAEDSAPLEEITSEEKDCRILVVDDNAINVEVTRVILADQGFFVDVAFDGKQALDKVNENAYDLIIMDCQMPVMDGYDATKAIRQLSSSHAELPIIGFTANAFKEVKEKCFESGMTDFLTKPVKQGKLVDLIEKYVA